LGKIIVGKISDIVPGKMIKASIDGRDVLVANIDGEYYATDDTCTHSGSSLSEGKLDGCTISDSVLVSAVRGLIIMTGSSGA